MNKIYVDCPNCHEAPAGTPVYKCTECGEMFCAQCRDTEDSWITSYCPHCGECETCDAEQYGHVEGWFENARAHRDEDGDEE